MTSIIVLIKWSRTTDITLFFLEPCVDVYHEVLFKLEILQRRQVAYWDVEFPLKKKIIISDTHT